MTMLGMLSQFNVALRGRETTPATKALFRVGHESPRLALVVVLLWIGAMKFTAYEAEAISGLVTNSPLLSWAYNIVSTRALSAMIGIVELAIAAMLAAGAFDRRVGAVGSLLSTCMFLTTLSFMVTTPGVFETSLGGFPALSVMPGQMLVKDIVLLGVSIWLFSRSLQATAP